MRTSTVLLLTLLLLPACAALAADTPAGDSTKITSAEHKNISLGGYLQFWWIMLEETENGLRQPLTGDTAARESSGFNIRRARFSVNYARNKIQARMSVKLEGSTPALRNAYVNYPLWGNYVELWGGQMKIPSTYEIAEPGHGLDFLTRNRFSSNIVDYSLAKSPPGGAPELQDAVMANRDLGLAFKGKVHGGQYYVFVGNGLGANRFVGGRERKEQVFTNDPGSHFYAARLSYGNLREGSADADKHPSVSMRAGGHVSWNYHPDIILEDEETVLDIKRFSWSADLRADVAGLVELTSMYGECFVEDDFNNDCKTDYYFRGWELKAVSKRLYDAFRLGFRYDAFADELNESGAEEILHAFVFGVTLEKQSDLRFQINYKRNVLESDLTPDLADDVLAFLAQIRF